MQFFVTTGNHDPARPFYNNTGKKDYLGTEGKQQPVFSVENKYMSEPLDHPVVIASNVAEMGYKGITDILYDYGFFPKQEFIYGETPFSTYNYEEYNYSKAETEAGLDSRTYDIPPVQYAVSDISYLQNQFPDCGFGLLMLTCIYQLYQFDHKMLHINLFFFVFSSSKNCTVAMVMLKFSDSI